MNLKQINEIRATAGLPALTVTKTDAAKRRKQEQNRVVRGEESRALKAARQGRGKK